jgi:hypothetical protein
MLIKSSKQMESSRFKMQRPICNVITRNLLPPDMHVYECHQCPRRDSRLAILNNMAQEPLAIRIKKKIEHKKQSK